MLLPPVFSAVSCLVLGLESPAYSAFGHRVDQYRNLKLLERSGPGLNVHLGLGRGVTTAGLDAMASWLSKHDPPDVVTIVHGDYKMDNVVFHPTEPRVLAVRR